MPAADPLDSKKLPLVRRVKEKDGIYARRSETLVAFTSAKTLSPGFSFIS
jgi:hypothetical protein